MPARMPLVALSADVSKAGEARNRQRSDATVLVRLGRCGPDDIEMNSAAVRASHGPVLGAATAGDDAQDRERSAAIRAVGQRRCRLHDLFGVGDRDVAAGYVASRGMKRSMWAFASAIAASGFDQAKPTSSAGNDRPSMTTGSWSVR